MTLLRVFALGFSILWALMASPAALGQTSSMALGTWQIHVPNYQATALAETPSSVYTATQGGLFRYIKEDNTLQTLSRNDGFSDMGIQALGYDAQTSTLVVAYRNTNLDLVQNGKVVNLSDLFRKSMPGEKKVYHLYTHNQKAYLATSFGLVVIDLVKNEIKDTYSNLGPQGQLVQVFASTILNDSLYIASSDGLMAASLNNPNLLDFRSWKRFGQADGVPQPTYPESYLTIASFNGSVYAGINHTGLYRYTGTTWQREAFQTASYMFRGMEANQERLVFHDPSEIVEANLTGQVNRFTHPLLQNISMVVPSANGVLWVASLENGLVKVAGNSVEAFVPNGPGYLDAFRLYVENNSYTVLAGGFNQGYLQNASKKGFYQLKDGQWASYHNNASAEIFPASAMDLVDAVRNPVTGKFYIASYGGGLIEWNGPDQVSLYNHQNSPLLSAAPGDKNEALYVRLTDLEVDANGSLWMVNRNQLLNKPGLFELTPEGTWVPHFVDFMPSTTASTNFDRLLIDDFGYKWLSTSVRYSPAGIVVYDSEKKYPPKFLNGTHGLPSTQIYAMVLDQNGEVWVGTSSGVAVFSSSADVFSSSFAGAYLPIFERRPLLDGQVVRTIAIDGGNRKWMGTDTGLWLFSENGEELIHSFTTKNSPLPSDKILDIAINHTNGEVVVATEGGIAIFRGAATVSESVQKDCLQVFPNPVRPGYSGAVAINGLPNNGWVKITDTAGFLVFEGKANGGTFAWNGRDYNGNRAKPGVYLVMATSADGSQTCTAKIAVQ